MVDVNPICCCCMVCVPRKMLVPKWSLTWLAAAVHVGRHGCDSICMYAVVKPGEFWGFWTLLASKTTRGFCTKKMRENFGSPYMHLFIPQFQYCHFTTFPPKSEVALKVTQSLLNFTRFLLSVSQGIGQHCSSLQPEGLVSNIAASLLYIM